MRVVTLSGFVLDVRNRNRHGLRFIAHRTALGDFSISLGCRQSFCALDGQDCARGSSFAVINVTDRAHVHVRLFAYECVLSHCSFLTDNKRESKKG